MAAPAPSPRTAGRFVPAAGVGLPHDLPTLPTDLSASPTTATGRAWSGLERSHLVTITDPCPSCGARFDVPVPLGADGNTTIRSRTHAAGCVAPTDPPQPTRLQETAAP